MHIFIPPVQPHASFNCIACGRIVVVDQEDRFLLEGETAELGCPGCGHPNQVSAKFIGEALERDAAPSLA